MSFLVRGRVQGVGFRMHARLCALRLGLKGKVRNDPGGNVSGIVSGDGEKIGLFLKQLREGSSLARVSQIETVNQPWQDFEDFEIEY